MKRLIIFLLLFAAIKVAGQTTGYLRFDTVLIYKQGGTAELILMNKTKDSLGILTNYNGGRTRFMRSRAINDSTIVVGLDTLVIRGATGGSGGTGDNTNLGLGYRILVPLSQGLKTLFAGDGILIDSTSNTNGLTFKRDTTGPNGSVTRSELLDSTDLITQTEKPIIVKKRSSHPIPDTLAILRGWGIGIDADSALTADSAALSAYYLRRSDSTLYATQYDLTQVTSGINQLTGDVTAGPGTGSQPATIAANAVTDAKLRQGAARSVIGRSANSTGNVADIASSTANRALTDNGTSLDWRQIDLTNTVTGELPENNLAAFRTYPTEGTGTWTTIYDQSAWTPADLGAQFSRGANHTISLNGSFPRIASSTILWGGASVTRFLPNNPILASADSILLEYSIVTPNVGFGLTMQSNNVNGANFGYTMYSGHAASPGSTNLAKQDGTSTQTSTSIAWTTGDVIRQTMSFRDTILVVTFQNLTTGSAISTITKSFVAGVAPYPPNTGTWGFQNFSGTYEIRRVKIMSRKITSPTLMTAFDSKGQIIVSPWNLRFPNLLNARYPRVLNYSGGGDQLKDFIDKRIEFSRLNPEQILIGLGSNDLRYGSTLATTLDRADKVVKMLAGSTTRWAITVVPEDSTAGGIGLTAFKNSISALYPSNYIDLWTFMSTSNVLKAEYNSGDGIHPNTAGHRVIDSLIAASGFFSVQSVNRRTPYQKTGGGFFNTGDSAYSVFKTPFSLNSLLKFNDSNQVTGSLLFDNGSRLIASLNYPHAPTPTAGTIFQVDGGFSVTSNTGFIGINDKTNSVNRHSFQSDNNILRHAYNGTEDIFIDNSGLMSIGTINSGLTFTPTFWIKKNRTMTAGSVDSRGITSVDDSIAVTMPGGMHSNVYKSKIAEAVYTAGSAEAMTRPATLFVEKSRASTNVTFTNPYAIYATGRVGTDSTYSAANMDSTTSATGGFVYRDFATGNYKLTAAPSGGTTLYTGDGTLSGNRTVSGGSNSLSITGLSSLVLSSSDNISLTGTLNLAPTSTATDANYTVLTGASIINLIEITANRTIALPTASAGKLLIIWNQNSSVNSWSFGGGGASVIDPAGASITTLTNDTVYMLLGTGSAFLKIN